MAPDSQMVMPAKSLSQRFVEEFGGRGKGTSIRILDCWNTAVGVDRDEGF